MNNRYIDFVPMKHRSTNGSFGIVEKPKKTTIVYQKTTTTVETELPEEITAAFLEQPEPIREEIVEPKPQPARQATYGVVENYAPIGAKAPVFTKTNVEKRPLHDPNLTVIKSQKIIKKPFDLEPPVREKKEEKPQFSSYKTPKNPFINTSVEKRPLSKNVYRREEKLSKDDEEESGPIRIVETPKKNSCFKTILIILITIVLGAAVGTVAYLLLPK